MLRFMMRNGEFQSMTTSAYSYFVFSYSSAACNDKAISCDAQSELLLFYRKLFELLSLCTALAELSWPAILSKRHTFRYIKLCTSALEYQNMGYCFISGCLTKAGTICYAEKSFKILTQLQSQN